MNELKINHLFSNGMNMDIGALSSAGAGVYSSALNGTIVTRNGDEGTLLTDMGNARVETAFLPEGYIPLGMAELGGIIYVVSFNPLSNKCLIGSFPSPELNITTTEVTSKEITLSSSDFKIDTKTGAKVYYLKKDLNQDLLFSPGDKFIVYGDTIEKNYPNFYKLEEYTKDNEALAKEQTLKLELGTITDSGKLIKFSHLKKYQLANGGYHIYQSDTNPTDADLDSYRSLMSLPYNIFNSKISGRLVLIAELIQFDEFSVNWNHNFTHNAGNKLYAPSVHLQLNGQSQFIPKGVVATFELKKGDTVIATDDYEYEFPNIPTSNYLEYEYNIKDIISHLPKIASELNKLSKSNYFDSDKREPYSLVYKITPCMNWGTVDFLTSIGEIQLDKIGTGFIAINSWKYYVNDNISIDLFWGLDVYEEEGFLVHDVKMHFTRLLDKDTKETTTLTLPFKHSYSGTFLDMIDLNVPSSKLTLPLKSQLLYLVTIEVNYTSIDNTQQLEPRLFYRWLYTAPVFNRYYLKEKDFSVLHPELATDIKHDMVLLNTPSDISQIKDILLIPVKDGTMLPQGEDTYRMAYNEGAVSFSCTTSIVLKGDYGIFDYVTDNVKIDTTVNKIAGLSSNEPVLKGALPSSMYTKIEERLGYDIKNNLTTNILSAKTFNISEALVINTDNNMYVIIPVLHIAKGVCDFKKLNITIEGKMVPLAYDDVTFNLFGLIYDNSIARFRPNKLGSYGLHEYRTKFIGKVAGDAFLGITSNTTDFNQVRILHYDEVDIDFTANYEQGKINEMWGNQNVLFAAYWTNNPWAELPLMIRNRHNGSVSKYATDKTKLRVTLFLREKDTGHYFPINFTLAIDVASSKKTPADFMLDSKFTIYADFASILLQLYRYVPDTFSVLYWVPDNYIYSHKHSYNVKALIQSEVSNNSKTVMIKGDNGNIDIKQYHQILTTDINDSHLNNNTAISFAFTNEKEFIYEVSYSLKSLGKELLLSLENGPESLRGVQLMDYDGVSIIKEYNGPKNPLLIYHRNGTTLTPFDTNSKTFSFYSINISKGIKGEFRHEATSNKIGDIMFGYLSQFPILYNFTLDNGVIKLRSHNSNDVSMWVLTEDLSAEVGNWANKIIGAQEDCLIDKYRAY